MSLSVSASQAHSRLVARTKGKNFYFSFLTLGREMRTDMCVLYAFLRQTDDLADGPGTVEEKQDKLRAWRKEFDDALEDKYDEAGAPCLPAVAELVRRQNIPAEHLHTVITGCERDLGEVRLKSWEELEDYCYHVAGAVGLCCLRVWLDGEEPTEEQRQQAVDTGTAFQLTNILRDLKEDAKASRVYVPDEDLNRFGCTRAQLTEGWITDEYLKLMEFEVSRARAYYDRSAPLVENLPGRGQNALEAMRSIYGRLLDEIERREYDVFSSRISLPWWKKVGITARVMLPF